MNICMCGAMAGYPHAADCPRPLFRASDSDVEVWLGERYLVRLAIAAAERANRGECETHRAQYCAECWATIDSEGE